MALVDYPSSSEDETPKPTSTSTSPSLKRKHPSSSSSDLPPLPSKFHSLYASTVRTSTHDDSSLHGGRKRVAPHIDGNWPSHVYIEWYPSTTEHALLSTLISKLSSSLDEAGEEIEVETFLTSELGVPLPLHISLSRPIGFLTEKKDGFLDSLRGGIKSSGVRPFKVTFSSLDWVPNHERTRWFLVLRLKQPESDGLNKLLHVTNTIVQIHGQPPLYISAPPSPQVSRPTPSKKRRRPVVKKIEFDDVPDLTEAFHFSVAWSLKAPSEEVKELTKRVMEELKESVEGMRVGVEEVKVKIGNVVSEVELSKGGQVEGGSLFGL